MATKMSTHWVLTASAGSRGSPLATVHSMWMEVRPVCTIRLVISTSEPTGMGLRNSMCPT